MHSDAEMIAKMEDGVMGTTVEAPEGSVAVNGTFSDRDEVQSPPDDQDSAADREVDQTGDGTKDAGTPLPEELALEAASDHRRMDSMWGLLAAGGGGEDRNHHDPSPDAAAPMQAFSSGDDQPIAEANNPGSVREGLPAAAGEEEPVVAEMLPPGDETLLGDWEENGSDIFEEVLTIIRRHFALPDEAQLALAIWIFYAHLYELFQYSPFLSLETPTKRSGKTHVLALMQALIPGSQIRVAPTAASVMREIDADGCAILFDETDRWLSKNKGMHTLLNAAHYAATAFITRCEDGVHRVFRVYGPKALASIGPQPDTLRDRCIVLLFLRKRPEDSVLRLTDEWLDQYAAVGARIARWAASHRDEIATRVNAVEGLVGISDRANDNWGPLLAIAEVLGHRWADAVRKAAVKISLAADDESLDPGEQLLRDIQRVFNDARCPAEMTVDALYTALLRLPESLWAAMDSGHPLTKNRMGRILKSFGVHSTSTRLKRKGKSASAVERVYRYADLDGLFKRYCPPPSAEDAAPETQGHAPKLVANPRNAPPEAVAVRDLTSASQPATPADPPSAVPGGAWVTGQGVRALRKKLKLTQAELAMLVGVSAQSVTTWEGKKGKLSLRPATLKEVLAVRTMGVGAARQKLALLGGSLKKVGGGKKVPRRKKRSMRKVVRGTRKSRARQAVMPKRKNAGAN